MSKRQVEKRISLIPENGISNAYIKDSEYLFLLKKTEKIIMATYILSDFIPERESLKRTLKDNSHETLDGVCDLLYKRSDRLYSIQKIKSSFIKLLTQYSLAEIGGFISKMNSQIIKEEINNLMRTVDDLERELSDEVIPDLKQNYFNVDARSKRQYSKKILTSSGKGHSKGQKDTKKDNVLENPSLASAPRDTPKPVSSFSSIRKSSSGDRVEKVLEIINTGGEVSIKDISNQVLDCSEKTIQRLLNKLIAQGKIDKKGDRRWARYSLQN